MAAQSADDIPLLYRLYFQWSDPLVCLWAFYMDFFTPEVVINAFIPLHVAPHNPQHDFLLQQLGGGILMLGILDVVLLRYSKDVMVWKILEGATLVYDLVLLYSIYDALGRQGRLSLHDMRATEDWGSIGITALAAVVRTAFLLDVGMGGKGKGRAKGTKKQ